MQRWARLTVLWMLACFVAVSAYADTQILSRATTFERGQWQPITLPDNWEQSRPDQGGARWYQTKIFLKNTQKLKGVFIQRACNQVTVYANGVLLWQPSGERSGARVQRFCHYPILVSWPAGLQRQGLNTLSFRVYSEPATHITSMQRVGYLSSIQVSDWPAAISKYQYENLIRIRMSFFISSVFGISGLMILWLWWRYQRDRLYFYFGLLQALGGLGVARIFVLEPVISNEVMERGILAIALLLALVFTGLVEAYIEWYRPWHRRLRQMLALVFVAACIGLPSAWLLQGSQILYAVAMLVLVEMLCGGLYFIWRRGYSVQRQVFAVLVALIVGVTLHDYLVQAEILTYIDRPLIQIVMPMIVLFLLMHLISRYALALKTAEASQQELEKRVELISREIEHSYQITTAQQQQLAAQAERERIAKDLHDDLGARLLTLMHSAPDHSTVHSAREALADLRLLINELNSPQDSMLDDIIAGCRAELAQRCEAAQRRLYWQQQDLPMCAIGARQAITLTRLCREATTNILKHTATSAVRVSVLADTTCLTLCIDDEYACAKVEAWQKGMGMLSMQQRSEQLQACLSWQDLLDDAGAKYGTRVCIRVPWHAFEPEI
jgi:two-component system sensor histidine kinase UhpB